MSGRRPARKLLAGALALAVVVAGVLIAVLGGGSTHSSGKQGGTRLQREVAVAAAYVGLSSAQVQRELAAGRSLAQIAALRHRPVAGLVNQLTAVRAATHETGGSGVSAPLRTVIRRSVERSVHRPGLGGPPAIGAGGPVAAAYLGMSTAQIRAHLRSGRTLAQIADSIPGRSARGLVETLLRARRRAVLRASANGSITAAAEHRLLASLRERLTIAVHRRLAN
jgi:hypothetical protein